MEEMPENGDTSKKRFRMKDFVQEKAKKKAKKHEEELKIKVESEVEEESEEDSSEEEDSEEDQNIYEHDGFVVPDEEVEEESAEVEVKEISKVHKPKKRRMRLKKKEVEEYDQEDFDLIRENLKEKDQEEPSKHPKLSEESEEVSDQEDQVPMYTDLNTLASIFAYNPQQTTASVEKEPEFEPAEKKERFKTKEHELIKSIDIPERLQHRLKFRENPTHDEIQAETDWIYSRLITENNQEKSDNLKLKISRFLNMYRVDKNEIPFIYYYRMHLLSPELTKELLWEIEKYDFDWAFVHENKIKFRNCIIEAADNAMKLHKGEGIDEDKKFLRFYENPGHVPHQIWELLSNEYSINFIKEIHDLQKFVDNYICSYPIKKSNDPILLAISNRIPEFIEKFGINPIHFSENLRRREIVHMPPEAHYFPEDSAFDFLCDLYKDGSKVISVAQILAKKDLASLPWVRKFIRDEYKKYVKLYTYPTDTGKSALDIYHPQYRVKCISGKDFGVIDAKFWADVWKAEKNGWIQTEFKLPWKSHKDGKILDKLIPLLNSPENTEIALQWNYFRVEIIEKMLDDLYEEFSQECYNELSSKAEDFIIDQCKKSYRRLLCKRQLVFEEDEKVKPSGKDHLEEDVEKKKIIVIVTDHITEYFGQTVLVVMDSNGAVAEIGYFRTLAARNFEGLSKSDMALYKNEKRDVEKIILAHHPYAVVIAANCLHAINIKKYIMNMSNNLHVGKYNEKNHDWKIEQNSLLHSQIKVFFHDIEVPKLFASSQRAKSLFPEGDILLKTAVSLGRFVQFPLSETLGLWSDPNEVQTTLLSLDPMQKLVNAKRLEWQLENVACEEVSKVGVDINKIINYTHLQASLAFVPGLGPAKAYDLIESIFKKFKGKLKMRAALINKRLLTSKVYENCAGFIYIRYEEKETDPLDSTRIHPESYEKAQRIAKSALELPDIHREDEAIARIMREPSYMKDLALSFYAGQLEKAQGVENMIEVLNFIVDELSKPFYTEKKKFEEPSGIDLIYLLSGESRLTLSAGKLVQCTVIGFDEHSKSLIVKLESGLKGSIDQDQIFPDKQPTTEEMKAFIKGMSLTARVLDFLRKPPESDVLYRIRLSVLPKELSDHSKYLKDLETELEHGGCFKRAEEDWNDKTGLDDDEYRQGQKYVPRVVNHQKFRNIGLKTACEELSDKDIGECLFRPSSRGQDHITCTWKFYNNVYAHLDIIEEGKPAQNMLGTKFKIGEEVYEFLQEIIDRYISPCEKLTKEAISNPKFKDFSNNIPVLLKQEKRSKPSTIPYYFTILEQYPQFLVLYYLPKEKVVSEYIKVKPRGLFFHEAYHTSLNYLIGWFKRHHLERNYQAQLQRIKPPQIDITNHYAIKGKVEKPMTPLYSAPNTPRRDEGPEEMINTRSPDVYERQSDDRRDKRPRSRSRGERINKIVKRDDKKCRKCGSDTHLSKDCIKNPPSNCYNCGKEGHFAKECTERRNIKRPGRDEYQEAEDQD
ncbi:hypothetical protein SteCoe_24471 [Stentor coeruleus]|uniref:Transcription elongation factor spt6 n=1 Tax=Stentor coeruleus TaxID=5963 RepID=A0A1R2BHL0_9CILI|nr:hypothetical protein SteCoe_24471 [Stentor coeruleus]